MKLLPFVVFPLFILLTKGGSVSVELQAPWPTHALSPLIEAAEFLDALDHGLFKEFIETVVKNDSLEDINNRMDNIQLAIKLSRNILISREFYTADTVNDILKLLSVALQFRTYAPAVEQQRQLSLQTTNAVLNALTVSGADESIKAWVLIERDSQLEYISEEEQLDSSAILDTRNCNQECNSEPESIIGVYEFDHMIQGNISGRTVVVLNGLLGSISFSKLYNKILEKLANYKCSADPPTLILRFAPSKALDFVEHGYEKTLLQGFGATLDIKNMEYITVDDTKKGNFSGNKEESDEISEVEVPVMGIDFAKLKSRYSADSEVVNKLETLKEILAEENAALELEASSKTGKLKVWEITNLGLQTTKQILEATDPLKRFEDIVSNFPLRANTISKDKVSKKLKRAVKTAGMQINGADGVILVNGVAFNAGSESFNLFELFNILKEELLFANELRLLGISSTKLEKFLKFSNSEDSEDSGNLETQEKELRVDIRKGGKGSILFLNNIERDARYSNWPSSIKSLLQPTRQLIPIRKNLYTIIFVMNPRETLQRSALSTFLYFLELGAPVRFGVVLEDSLENIENDVAIDDNMICGSRCFLQLYLASKENAGKQAGIAVLSSLAAYESETLPIKTAIEIFAETMKKETGSWGSQSFKDSAENALKTESGVELLMKMQDYIKSKGFEAPSWILNGLVRSELSNIDREITQAVFHEQRHLMMDVWSGSIDDKTDVLKYILSKANAVSRYNPLILQPKEQQQYVKLPFEPLTISRIEYITKPVEIAQVTIWVILDLTTPHGRKLALEAIDYAETDPSDCRLAILHLNGKSFKIWKGVYEASSTDLRQVRNVLKEETKKLDSTLNAENDIVHQYIQRLLPQNDTFSSSFLIANGRLIELTERTNFGVEEFEMLSAYLIKEIAGGVAAFLGETVSSLSSDLVLFCSALAGIMSRERRQFIPIEDMPKEVLDLTISMEPNNPESSYLSVKTIINPLSRESQAVAPILRFIHSTFNAKVHIILLPELSVSTFPLQNFYRLALNTAEFALGKEHERTEEEEIMGSLYPLVQFQGMPKSQLLTLKLFTPEYWIVYPYDTGDIDTDNIKLESDGDVQAEYVLKSLLITGHAYDITKNKPPAGMQLELEFVKNPQENGSKVLVDSISSFHSDTIVMNNLGYFQLQANPGVWAMELAPGPSREIYILQDKEFYERDYRKMLVLRSFDGNVESLEVQRREGMEEVELLESLEEGKEGDAKVKAQDGIGGLWNSVRESLFDSRKNRMVSSRNDTIHVFSLASGALYERFLRIMMVSVVSATQSPVKFWIIENFLSPRFKRTIEKLSAVYNFEFALITYRWPYWLHRQTEKQRIIWGYKILFLDVLFPINLPKVIYVDADQVVRADLRELWDMDLSGKPYGYTPFCDSRKETLGFQFWRSGYWKEHLRGRPYHISALYVVDLVVFRRMAVGDRLRAIYDGLSRDPNSLSNLDQDLPNYAQNMVPIYSLPQEWLWCETWCSDESKARAKTIDLCNNPLHKEPKLEMAKRIISGKLFQKSWIELDEEIRVVLEDEE